MVPFLMTTFLVSIFGVSSVLFLKYREVTTGHVLFPALRPRLNAFFHTILFWIERVIPDLTRVYSKRFISWIATLLHQGTATGVLHLERVLEKTLHTLRSSTDHRLSRKEASPFLREVAEHKKKLLTAREGTPEFLEE